MLISPPKPMIRLKLELSVTYRPIITRREMKYSMVESRQMNRSDGACRDVGTALSAGLQAGQLHAAREEKNGDEQQCVENQPLPGGRNEQHAERLQQRQKQS